MLEAMAPSARTGGCFVTMLDDLGREELGRRWEQARRLIHENGITTTSTAIRTDGPPVEPRLRPLLVTAAEWRGVGEALTQRAMLLDLILADLSAPPTVSRPPLAGRTALRQPRFSAACHGIDPPLGHRLHLYGRRHRRAPSGHSKSLRIAPKPPRAAGNAGKPHRPSPRPASIFRQCNVERLAPFFAALGNRWSRSPQQPREPARRLLTPGPYNETYFEHAYLARYLGYTLVQGTT